MACVLLMQQWVWVVGVVVGSGGCRHIRDDVVACRVKMRKRKRKKE
jgi:hypothetical protein